MVNVKRQGARRWRAVVAEMRPVLLLVSVMTVIAGGVGATMVGVLYKTAFEEERQRLLETVRCTGGVLETIASRVGSQPKFQASGGGEAAALALIQAAHTRYERAGEGAELMLGQRQGDDIVFLLNHSHEGLAAARFPPVPFDSHLAVPMRRALSGQSGTVVGLDHRGTKVLAAYAPIATLGFGVVSKLDLAAVRAPFVLAGAFGLGIAGLLIASGAWLFFRITNPWLRRLRESEARFRGISNAAQDAIIVMPSDGRVAFWNPAAERIFGYRSDEAVHQTLAELIVPPRYRARHEAAVVRFQATGEGPRLGHTTELEALTKAGDEFPIEISLAAMHCQSGWEAVAIIRDISERKVAEKQAHQRQELLSRIIENIPHAVFWKDRRAVYLGCNHRFAVHAGLAAPRMVVGKTDYDLAWTKPQADYYRSVDRTVMASGEARLNIEEPQRRADGTEAMLLTSKVALRDAAGKVVGLLGVYADITERSQAEAALQVKTSELEAIYRTLPDLMFRLSTDGAVLDYAGGPTAPGLYRPPAEFLGKRVQDVLPEEASRVFSAAFTRIAAGEPRVNIEYRLPMAEGGRDFEARLVPLREGELLALVRDVTEHRALLRGFAEREAKLRLILTSTGEGIFGINNEGRCNFANRACVEMLGYRDEKALLGQRMHQLTHHTRADGSPYPVEACPTYATCRHAKRTRVEGELLWRADGSAFLVDYQSHPMMQDGEVIGAVITFSDMTERLEAREALRRQRDFAESLIETAPVIILVLDPEGRIVRFNPFMAELTGYRLEEVKGQDWFATFLPERERERIRELFLTTIGDAPSRGNINPILTRSGEERLVAWHDKTLKDAEGQTIGCLAIGHDVTAEKEREAQLFQAQKMEVMGRLTGGIAHDFNNLLTVILGNLELIKERLPDEGLLCGFAEDALSAAQDGAALTQRLLGFARKTPLQPVALYLQDFLPQCERLLRRTLSEAITLEVDCDIAVPPLYVDRAQLESAILNLAINAQDAMPNGGKLFISANALEIGLEGSFDYPTLLPGDYVVVAVCDTGTGMTAEQLAHATEPFYTTKAMGKGSGLGLSMVYGFAKDSGGALRLRSELGEGAEASVALPVVKRQLGGEPLNASKAALAPGTGIILLVEDDPRVRKLAKQYLTASGYTIIETETGDAALEAMRSGIAPDVLFSDIALPGTLNGYALASRVAEDHPGVKVLLTTGADTDELTLSKLEAHGFPLLRKPYSAVALVEAIKSL